MSLVVGYLKRLQRLRRATKCRRGRFRPWYDRQTARVRLRAAAEVNGRFLHVYRLYGLHRTRRL